jgi:hypothetical protein
MALWKKTKTPTPNYALDNAVVVIEGMTILKGDWPYFVKSDAI